MSIFKFFQGRKATSNTKQNFYNSLYPEAVRYALSYKQAKMGKTEITSLIDRFTYEAHYLVIKAIPDAEGKRTYLEDITRIFAASDYHVESLKFYLYDKVESLPDDVAVNGTKLAQLNRSGSDNWQDAFHKLAENCFDEDQTTLPILIAHTVLLGYHHFVQLYKQLNKGQLIIIMPDWLMDPDNEMMGFDVRLGNETSVTMQTQDECLVATWTCQGINCPLSQRFCNNTYFIDDTINSGATAGKLKSFWHSEYGLSTPDDRIRVITDLRSNIVGP